MENTLCRLSSTKRIMQSMSTFLQHTLLNIPLYTWILQLSYVAVALGVLAAFAAAHKRTGVEIALFVAGIVVVDVVWRLAIR